MPRQCALTKRHVPRVMQLTKQGLGDLAISRIFGVDKQTIGNFRRRYGIPAALPSCRKPIEAPIAPPAAPREDALYGDIRYEDVSPRTLAMEFVAEKRAPRPRINLAAIHDPQPGRLRP